MSHGLGFELKGINHLALMSSDMDRTVDFYSGILGLPLVKKIELPYGMGKHYFFGLGNGDCLAFFWVPDAAPPAPGIAAPSELPGKPGLWSAIGSMNHVAFDVDPDAMEDYRERLLAHGIDCTQIANHDDSPDQVSRHMHPGVFMRSLYFFDPDGILLEFSCWVGGVPA